MIPNASELPHQYHGMHSPDERPEVMQNAHEGVAVIRSDYPDPLWIQAVSLIREQIDHGALKAGSHYSHRSGCSTSMRAITTHRDGS